MRAVFRSRLRLVLVGVSLVALLIVGRLYVVQIVQGDAYTLKADRQHAASGGGIFDRGAIYFTRKDGTPVSAATLSTGFLLAVNPRLIEDPEGAFASIVRIASSSIAREAFMNAVEKKEAVYVEVAHRLSDEVGKALREASVPGVLVLRERWRVYPGKDLAAQTLGTVGRSADDPDFKGRTGLEARYETTLVRDSDTLYRNFFAELFANLRTVLGDALEQKGDLITTLEPEVETRLMRDLAIVQEKYGSRETGGIIMDPATGAIIAIGSIPTYDANAFSETPIAHFTNPLVSHVYEFGSIMKPLTMAAALDAGVVTRESTYQDTGCLTLDTATICNFDRKARGRSSMQDILSLSLNIGAAHLAKELGGEELRKYFTQLGFGAKTGIDLPAEASGLVRNLESPREIEFATAAFGQGIAVTPVAMLRALGALANKGVPVTPHLARAVRQPSGITRTLTWDQTEAAPVFSVEAVREVTEMLTRVVDRDLAKGSLAIPTLSVAAKTGTAQLVDATGGYSKDRFFHSFFGYFPSYAPRFIILLYTYEPRGVQYASDTLTETFMDLVHFLSNYYDLPPDRAEIPAV